MPVVEPDNAKEEKHDNSVDTAGNGIESLIGYVNILKLSETPCFFYLFSTQNKLTNK